MASYLNPQPSNAILDDIANIRELENYNAQSDPSLGSDFPVGAKRFVNIGTTSAPQWQWQRYDGTSWKVMANTATEKLMHNVDMLDGYHASTSAVANTIPVYNADNLLVGGITGNAATATKLATARNLQVGGIASGDAKSFNGTAEVTLPINSINVNNNEDDAIVGVLTEKHGGTGRTDGAAQDVRVDSLAGETSAIANGQIGRAAILVTGTHLDGIVVPGNYRVVATDGPEYGHPYTSWGDHAFLRVVERGNVTMQVYTYVSYAFQFMRSSRNAGASWTGWTLMGGKYSGKLKLYVSKSGSDDNTGLTADRPLLTIDKALLVAKNFAGGGMDAFVQLNIGEGDWGNVVFRGLPFELLVYPFDGQMPVEYNESLPKFRHVQVRSCSVVFSGLVADALTATNYGYAYIANGYKRIGALRAHVSGTIQFNTANDSTNLWEISSQSIYSNEVMGIYSGGRIDLSGYLHIRLAENITVSNSFLICSDGYFTAYKGRSVFDSSDYTFTGKKCTLYENAVVNSHEANDAKTFFTEVLPGMNYSISNGAVVNGYTVGQAADNAVVHRTGAETVDGVKTFLQALRVDRGDHQYWMVSEQRPYMYQNIKVKKGEAPSSNQFCYTAWYSNSGLNTSDRIAMNEMRYDTNGGIYNSLVAFKPSATEQYTARITAVYPASGDPFGQAPSTPEGSTDNKIVTADFLQKNLTMAGVKIFTAIPVVQSVEPKLFLQYSGIKKGDTPTSNTYATLSIFEAGEQRYNANIIGNLGTRVRTDGSIEAYISARLPEEGSTAEGIISVRHYKNGNVVTYAPPPPTNANGTHIATTAWVRERFTISTAAPSGGTNGDFWFQY